MGYVTPGEILADYFQGDMIGILVVAVALLFPIPYLGVQLGASGLLLNVLTDDMVPKNVGHVGPVASMWLPAGFARWPAWIPCNVCCWPSASSPSVYIAYGELGGWGAFNERLAALGIFKLLFIRM